MIQQVVDRDPGSGYRAFDCGPQSYDGHTGTDIRVADFEAMAGGVAVLAAADGTVRALRDGMPDGGIATAPEGQGCGNGVALTHPNGWETQYCHLLQGSITVTEGQTVAAGTQIGLIGYSGRTEFPHLEFVVRQNGRVVDPFDPSDLSQCGLGAAPLWDNPIDLAPGGLLRVGFADAIPDLAEIEAGDADQAQISSRAEALVLWAFIHGGRAGDQVQLRIEDATGQVIHEQTATLDRTQAQLFRASGRRTPQTGWPLGVIHGHATLIRDGAVLDQRAGSVIVTSD